MALHPQASIRTKLLLLVVMALLPFLLLNIYNGVERRQAEIDKTHRDTTFLLEALATQQLLISESIRAMFQTLAQLPQVRNLDQPACDLLFAKLLRDIPYLINIGLFDPRGDSVAVGRPVTPFNNSGTRQFVGAVAGGEMAAGEFVIGRISGRPSFQFAFPVLDEEGGLLGVLQAGFVLDLFNDTFTRAGLPSQTVLGIFDHQGKRLYRFPPTEDFPAGEPAPEHLLANFYGAKQQGILTADGGDGRPRIFAFRQLKLADEAPPYMVFHVAVLQEEAFRESNRIMLLSMALLAGAILLAALIFGLISGRLLLYPLAKLVAVARNMGRGDLTVRSQLPHGRDELGQLASSFDQMAATIARREQELARMRNYLQNIFESMPSLLVAMDEQGVVTQWNSAAARHIGLSAAEAIGRKLYEVAPFLKPFAAQVAACVRSRDSLLLHRQQLTLEKESFFDLTIFPLQANGVDGVVLRLDDISELEKKEQQLRQAQKMEMVGALAGGLAHDFNNVLTGIMGNVSLLRYKQNQGMVIEEAELQEHLEQINAAGSRAADMVRQLLTLSRRHQGVQVAVDLQLAIKHVRKLCENTFDRAVRIMVRTPEGEEALVQADPTEMEQVLLNLCINAMHAMTIMRREGGWGGTLSISLERVSADENFRRSHPEARPGQYWRLAVSDSGVGIKPELHEKIFQPFFTTKEQDKGTGLGLAMVYSIVKHHGGFVGVYSEPDLGSTFSVYLPLLQRSAVAATGAEPEAQERKGTGLILVVDDDAIVRKLAGEALQLLGYQVVEAVNGREAVELYRQRHREIAGVLLDLVMPVLSGREAFMALREINPAVAVVLTSGFRQDERVEEVMRHGARVFLQKPYDLHSLARALDQALRG